LAFVPPGKQEGRLKLYRSDGRPFGSQDLNIESIFSHMSRSKYFATLAETITGSWTPNTSY